MVGRATARYSFLLFPLSSTPSPPQRYGSTATGMALPDSDLDCVVVPDTTSETVITTMAEMVSVR